MHTAIDCAMRGEKVLWVEPSMRRVRKSFDLICNKSLGLEVRIVRAYGRERIDFPSGGQIVFVNSGGTGYRGMSADHLFVSRSVWGACKADLVPTLPVGGELHFLPDQEV